MKKKLFALLFSVILLGGNVFAATSSNDTALRNAIQKYKSKNYSGCIQDLEYYTKVKTPNSLAYYYLAMSYAQAGLKDKAIEAYDKVLKISSNATMKDYAQKGKTCLTNPDQCYTKVKTVQKEELTPLDKFIERPYGDGLSDDIKLEIQKQQLENLRKQINADDNIEQKDLQKFKNLKTQSNAAVIKEEINNKKPSNDEIVAAMNTLKNAGFNPLMPLQNASIMPQQQIMTQQMMPQNAELAQLQMLMGNANQNGNNSNAMMNMLPFMFGQNGSANQISPQAMQAMMMNSMLGNLNFDMGNDKN